MGSRLYCGDCGDYLMAGDGECKDCHCGWKQPIERCSECNWPKEPDTAFCEGCDSINIEREGKDHE